MQRRNALEWLILALSVAAVAAVIGVLIYEGLADQGRPPRPSIVLHRERAYATPSGWVLPATAGNHSDQSAHAVGFRAVARVDGREELAEITVDYLPAGSEVELAFGFSGEPAGAVRVRVTGFLP